MRGNGGGKIGARLRQAVAGEQMVPIRLGEACNPRIARRHEKPERAVAVSPSMWISRFITRCWLIGKPAMVSSSHFRTSFTPPLVPPKAV